MFGRLRRRLLSCDLRRSYIQAGFSMLCLKKEVDKCPQNYGQFHTLVLDLYHSMIVSYQLRPTSKH